MNSNTHCKNRPGLPRAAGIAALLAATLAACASLPSSKADMPGGGEMAYTLAGQGGPTVVLQAGLGDGKDAWQSVFQPLARNGAVFAYDRPGYGATPSGTAPRDPCSVAEEERRLLQTAGLKPPYILAGHSIGGLYQYAFAALYPHEVAGLVLLDPTHPRHWERMQQEAPAQAAIIKGMLTVTFSGAMKREFDEQAVCTERLMQAGALRMPVRLLMSGRSDIAATPAFTAMQDGLRQDWLRLSGAARAETLAQSGHYLQKDAPDAVIAAIEAMRRNAR
ncbi:alpha/beta fold hydrolase [Massilia sp. NR 4-1]|uniref:alpha/beta fold hydrolase n=1 Tax=Massilia sp. NR 4-1 TaxID=1678028 RepID=UPI00067AB03E|nr:alpha/beta hydrolase [Massilia sp. NR 4-1]